MTDHKKTIADYENRIQELEGSLRHREQRNSELITSITVYNTKMTQLETRLDACLYAMVLFQSLIRSSADKLFKFNETTKQWENVSVMEKEVKLAT